MAADYKLKNDPGVIRAADGAHIPEEPLNRDWQEYQAWLGDGNTPDPADPLPIVYTSLQPFDTQVRTTNDALTEVFRFATEVKHVYRATVGVTGIDAGSGVTRDSEVRLVFKRTAAGLAQVGATVVLSNMQDAAASTWRIVPSIDGTDLVISVGGAVGRTIDWTLHAELGVFAPEGLT